MFLNESTKDDVLIANGRVFHVFSAECTNVQYPFLNLQEHHPGFNQGAAQDGARWYRLVKKVVRLSPERRLAMKDFFLRPLLTGMRLLLGTRLVGS